MSRIIPQFKDTKSQPPAWFDAANLLQASASEREQNKAVLQKLSAVQTPEVVTYYGCPSCKTKIAADSQDLKSQANLAIRAKEEVKYLCPSCSIPLAPYETVKVASVKKDIRYADQTEVRRDLQKEASGTINTYVDRHLVFRAVNEMERFASKNGMTMVRARFIKADRSKLAGQEYPLLNDIACELSWKTTQNRTLNAKASVSIDVAGKFIMPRLFTTSDGKDHPFEKAAVRALEKEAEYVHKEKMVQRKSDQPIIKKPDISRFHATSSLKLSDDQSIIDEVVEGSKKKVVKAVITAPNATAETPVPATNPVSLDQGQVVINPLDGKQYNVAQNTPTGVVLIDPATQQQSMVPVDQAQNLKPVTKTTSFSVEAIANEIIREHLGEDFGTEQQEIKQHLDMIGQDVREIADDEALLHQLSSAKEKERVKNMSKTWKQIRESISIPSRKSTTNLDDVPQERWSRERRAAADLGYSPQKPDKDKTGHDKNTHLPFSEDKEITVGLTEFPKDQKKEDSTGHPMDNEKGYRIPFKEMNENQVEEREHFHNQDKLPIRNMKREELKNYLKDGTPEENYGLNDLEAEAMLDAVGFNKTSVGGSQPRSKVAAEGEEEGILPIEHRPLKTSPKMEEYKEPGVIPEAEGKLKEAITKFRITQKDIASVEAQVKLLLKPLKAQMEAIRGPRTEEIDKLKETLHKYLEMVWRELTTTENRVAAYEDSVFARLERQIGTGGTVTTVELMAELERVLPDIASQVNILRQALEEAKTSQVLQRILFEYPVSRTQEKKISSSDTSLDVLIQVLVTWLDVMKPLNEELAQLVGA